VTFEGAVTLSIAERITQIGVVPVVSFARVDDAVPVAEALLEGGLPCVEITFRTAACGEAIALLTARYPDLLVGAGTVLTVEQAGVAHDSGAQFLVAPGFSPEVVDRCLALNLSMIPGVCTPTEIEMALSRGITTVKFFPAEAAGGVKFLKAVSAPYKQVRFMPTGGIDDSNLAKYIALPEVAACGGSWMVKPDWIAARDYNQISRTSRDAVTIVRDTRSGK
jgi:2-dehydro-3-deoxyphosphogluconate aldolase/(4S)-4-hydroxy-2-oxoglutarate aldolase